MTKQSDFDELRHLVEIEGFVARDFLLTAPPARPFARERRRRLIARHLSVCGFSAHDLTPASKLSVVSGADGGRKTRSAEKERVMCADMTKYGGAAYLGVDDVREGSLRCTIAAVEISKKIDRPTLIFTNGLKFTVNITNTQAMFKAVGTDSEDWIGEIVELTLGEVEYKEKTVETVLLSVVPREPGVEKVKPSKPKPAKGSDGDMNDALPF